MVTLVPIFVLLQVSRHLVELLFRNLPFGIPFPKDLVGVIVGAPTTVSLPARPPSPPAKDPAQNPDEGEDSNDIPDPTEIVWEARSRRRRRWPVEDSKDDSDPDKDEHDCQPVPHPPHGVPVVS
jgi:hypothetical protein